MNFKKTLFLALVLGAAVVYLMKVSLPSRETEARQNVALGGVKAAALRQLSVSRRDYAGAEESTYKLVNTSPESVTKDKPSDTEQARASVGTWSVADRANVTLDQPGLSDLLSTMEGLRIEGPIKDSDLDKDFSVYGLHSPVLTLTVEEAKPSAPLVEVAFGKKNDYLSKRYVKISGRSGVYLAEEGAFGALNKSLKDIRSKNPLTFSDDTIKSFIAASAKGTVTVKKESATEWRIMDPYVRPASTLAVKTLLDSLRSLRAVDFIDRGSEAYGQYGLGTPRASVRLFFSDGRVPEHLEVLIGASTAGSQNGESTYFTFTGAPSIYKASTSDLAPFMVDAAALRERKVLKIGVNEIQKITASGPSVTAVEIEATNTDWNVNGKKSDPFFVEQFLNDLVSLQAAEFTAEPAESSFEKPYMTLIITKKGESKEQVTLIVGAEVITRSGTRRFVRVAPDGEPVLISDIDAKRIVPHEEALIEKIEPTPAAQPPPDAALQSAEVAPAAQ
jgi:hypothetical protein